ncbi:IS3 family transposase [Curtobacterium sp. MCBA15_001]|uniref:IS3 family transposase n=1 Tax=Curtobacterium sp. MCBA15_001 TaxID=1898731 RepID=UPI0009F67177|nr:IS3 family transposase [Curtobacterium sp. MCBA15_001]
MKVAEVTAKKVEFARLLAVGLTVLEAGRAVGIGATSSRRWAALVRSGGVERLVLVSAGDRPAVPFALKWQAVKAVNAGHSQTSVMEALRLPSETSIRNWPRAVAEYGAAGIGGTESAVTAADLLPMPSFRAPANVRHSEEARRVFAAVVAAGDGYETASKQAGVPMSTAWAWYHRLRRGESISLAAVAPTKSYTAELKLAAARAVVDDGMTRAEALAHFGVRSHASLGAWMQAYRRHGASAFDSVSPAPATRSSPSDDLFAQLDPALPIDVKVQMVTALADRHPVRVLLRTVKLAPSTYYYRRSRPPKTDRYAQIRPLLRSSFHRAYRAYGYRGLRLELRHEHGVRISGKTTRRLMREESCRCLVRRRKPRTTRPDAPENVFAPNLLRRDWSTTTTGQKWVTDVTQFSINGQLLFL